MKTDPRPRRNILPTALAVLMSASPATGQTPAAIPSGTRPAIEPVLLDPGAQVTCGGVAHEPVSALPLAPGLRGSTFVRPETGQRIARVGYRFEIDDRGRPVSIAPLSPGETITDTLNASADQTLQADFAAWRFPGEVRRECRLIVGYTPVPVSRAEPDLLAAFFAVNRTSGPARQAVEARLSGEGANCAEDRPTPRRFGAPDFRAGRSRVGGQDWTVVRWSVDEAGRSVDIETLASSGDTPFDKAAREATAATETEPGSRRTGCVYNWYRRGHPLPAPPIPEPPRDSLAACPKAVLDTFRASDAGPGADAAVPRAFLDRGIEGWALVRFDIAPWGEVGHVEVIEAQPAAGFAAAARTLVARGRAEAGEGAVRCIQPVVFRVPPEA